ncbi:hypothetical protein [Aminobacterium mobile]|uniref:hypothetical protein n=1 Tax=Aminobacterium mobile TaxID=81467 RepID=UPI0004632709|nr:hypothetical protein [Aminobacterium mobile]
MICTKSKVDGLDVLSIQYSDDSFVTFFEDGKVELNLPCRNLFNPNYGKPFLAEKKMISICDGKRKLTPRCRNMFFE